MVYESKPLYYCSNVAKAKILAQQVITLTRILSRLTSGFNIFLLSL
jgi:hypothetical protein